MATRDRNDAATRWLTAVPTVPRVDKPALYREAISTIDEAARLLTGTPSEPVLRHVQRGLALAAGEPALGLAQPLTPSDEGA